MLCPKSEFIDRWRQNKTVKKKAARALVAAYRSDIFNRTVEQRKGLR